MSDALRAFGNIYALHARESAVTALQAGYQSVQSLVVSNAGRRPDQYSTSLTIALRGGVDRRAGCFPDRAGFVKTVRLLTEFLIEKRGLHYVYAAPGYMGVAPCGHNAVLKHAAILAL